MNTRWITEQIAAARAIIEERAREFAPYTIMIGDEKVSERVKEATERLLRVRYVDPPAVTEEKTAMDAIPATIDAEPTPDIIPITSRRHDKPRPVKKRTPRILGDNISTLPDGTVIDWGKKTPRYGAFTRGNE